MATDGKLYHFFWAPGSGDQPRLTETTAQEVRADNADSPSFSQRVLGGIEDNGFYDDSDYGFYNTVSVFFSQD